MIDYILGGIILLVMVLALASIFRSRKNGTCGGCSGCASADRCSSCRTLESEIQEGLKINGR